MEEDTLFIRKERVPKRYRIEAIDKLLRKSRTRREAKVLRKLPVNGPKLINVDEKNMVIDMEHIDGAKIRDHARKENCIGLGEIIGEMIAIMHNADIMHGDLTTSNMIIKNQKIYFIDFGLSFFSSRIDDRVVDLHLIKEALQSTHHEYNKECFEALIKRYKQKAKKAEEILRQFDIVEQRGRYKHKS
jgi:Kae1-associated kinase Bud32